MGHRPGCQAAEGREACLGGAHWCVVCQARLRPCDCVEAAEAVARALQLEQRSAHPLGSCCG